MQRNYFWFASPHHVLSLFPYCPVTPYYWPQPAKENKENQKKEEKAKPKFKVLSKHYILLIYSYWFQTDSEAQGCESPKAV